MADEELKATMLRYLQQARASVLWKLDGLDDYAIRRPMTATGTNLLGIVKHLCGVEMGYLGDTFGAPYPGQLPWPPDNDPWANDDMWATAAESRAELVAHYRAVWAHVASVIETLELSSPGRVPWWPDERADVTLGQILIHLIAEVDRHAGQMDIIRELLDGAAGLRPDNDNLPDAAGWSWPKYVAKIEAAAREAAG